MCVQGPEDEVERVRVGLDLADLQREVEAQLETLFFYLHCF